MDYIVLRVPKSWTWLNDFHFHIVSVLEQGKSEMYVCEYAWERERKNVCMLVMALEGASLVDEMVKKNVPAMQETQVQSLGCKDPLEKGMALLEKW